MKLSDISDIEYKYIFSLDNIKSAKMLNQVRCESVKDITFISNETKKKIFEFSEDFNSLANKIIHRNNMEDSDTYEITNHAITICNAKIADLLNDEEMNNKEYRKFLKKNKVIDKTVNCFEVINSKLGNSNYLEIKLNNWFTFAFIGFMTTFLSILLIIAYINQNYLDIFFLSLILAVLVVVITFKKEKVNKMIKHDYIQRIISKKEYSLSEVQEKYDHSVLETLKNMIKNKL